MFKSHVLKKKKAYQNQKLVIIWCLTCLKSLFTCLITDPDSDEDNRDLFPSSSMAPASNSYSEEDGIATRGNIGHVSSTATTSTKRPSSFSGAEPDSSREQLAHNASLSVQEQHATNALLGTVSRSLELLAESVQQLAETQQEFARESLQLQRDTVQVLREFASGALTILHEKVNGKPALWNLCLAIKWWLTNIAERDPLLIRNCIQTKIMRYKQKQLFTGTLVTIRGRNVKMSKYCD